MIKLLTVHMDAFASLNNPARDDRARNADALSWRNSSEQGNIKNPIDGVMDSAIRRVRGDND